MSLERRELYEFGGFRLDIAEHTLTRIDSEKVALLPEKAFQTLCILVQNSGHLLTKQELLDRVWPDSFVEENNVDKCIYAIRNALGEKTDEETYIETVRKHGYRFVAEVCRVELADDLLSGVSYSVASLNSGVLGASLFDARRQGFKSAFDAYQLARMSYMQMTAPTSIESRLLVNEALLLDPDFALAHSLSAELTTHEVIVGLKWPKEGFAEARASIARARELGAKTPEFYTAAAYVSLIADWDFSAAEKSLKTALKINPHYGLANRIMAEVYMFQGFHGAATAHIKRAQVETELHNLNILAISRFLARDYAAVIDVCDKMIELSPRHLFPAWTRCPALEQMGRLDEAIAGYEQLLKLPNSEPVYRWAGNAYAMVGNREKALEIASMLDAAAREHNMSPTHQAAIYASLGEIERAVSLTESGLEMREPFMLWIPTDPRFDALRGNERFEAVVKSVLEKGTAIPTVPESKNFSAADALSRLTVVIEPERNRRFSPKYVRWLVPAAAIVVVAIAAIIGARLWQDSSQTFTPGPMTEKRLTVGGGATRVAMSKDGHYAAVAQNATVVVFDLQNGGERILVPASKDIRIATIAFPADNSTVYYGTRPVDGSLVTVYRIPIEGGEPVKIIDNIYGSLSFSPDGRRFAFLRRYPELNEYALLTADSDGSNVIRLASSQLPNRLEANPAWSPDGTRIACPAISIEGGFHYAVAQVDAGTGLVEFVPNQRWSELYSLVWLADSERIVVAGQDEKSINAQVWRLDTKSGQANRVTNDAFVYESIAGTPQGEFVAVKVRQSSHVWMLGDQQIQVTAGFDNNDGVRGIAWSGDGNIYYHSRAGGRDAIWRMRRDGSNASEVTPDTAGGFSVSPDGRLLVFQGKQPGDHLGLQVKNLADGTERALTQNVTAQTPSFFPDGKRLAFTIYDKKLSIYELAVDGGQPQLLSGEHRSDSTPSVSPSGKYVAFIFNRAQNESTETGIAIVDSETRQLIARHPARINAGSLYEASTLQWSADESEVYFIQLVNSVSNLMRLRLSDGTISNLTNFADGRIFNFAVEPGGNRILVARGFVERDATLFY